MGGAAEAKKTFEEIIFNYEDSDIALQAKVDVPYSCQGGVCCSCTGTQTR